MDGDRDRERILEAAHHELLKLDKPKVWMTARGLAARIRSSSPKLEPVSQVALFEALCAHAEHRRPRLIRNSTSPSARTLEVLWGAIEKVDERDVDPPRKRATGPSEEFAELERAQKAPREGDESDDALPIDFFLSYNFADAVAAAQAAEIIERRGYSVWMAGASIAGGEIINDTVRSAMRGARGMLLYLSGKSLRSLWVAKEQLVGALQDLPRSVIVDGSDADLVALVLHWIAAGDDAQRKHDFGGLLQVDPVSYRVAVSFREQLRRQIEDPRQPIYAFPASPVQSERLLPLESFPQSAARGVEPRCYPA